MSSRTKALLPIDGGRQTFLSHILSTLRAAHVDDLEVVLGHDAAEVRQSLAGLDFPMRVIENPHFERGQLSSLQAGLVHVDRPGVRATSMLPNGPSSTSRKKT